MQRRGSIAAAFTLVEMIIVMALLAVVAAIAAPQLGRSMKERSLADETRRFLAATEYARSEAASQGVPMVVWADFEARRVGIEPKTGFDGEPSRTREYVLNPDISMQADQNQNQKLAQTSHGTNLIEFSPDGSVSDNSVETVKLFDRFGYTLLVARTKDRWSYEIQTAR